MRPSIRPAANAAHIKEVSIVPSFTDGYDVVSIESSIKYTAIGVRKNRNIAV